MAMTTCPQCDGEMSNYAPSCPHCGKMNPAAPQAILLQEKWGRMSTVSQMAIAPAITVEPVNPEVSERLRAKKGFDLGQWVAELRAEWKELKPTKKPVVQMLFGFAIVVGVGLFVYTFVF